MPTLSADDTTKHNGTPKVLISYSWDSTEHKEWVRALAERLVANGIKVFLDQWDLAPGQSLTQFMEAAIANSDYVVVICTPSFSARANARAGGVGYEQQIISGRLLAGMAREKFIPIVRVGQFQAGPDCALPHMFSGSFALDMRTTESEDASMETLIRAVFRRPLDVAPRLGNPPLWLGSANELSSSEMPELRLATTDLDGWTLISGLAQHHRTPETFYMPTERDRRTLRVGDDVKLMFDIELAPKDNGAGSSLIERMWVKVSGKAGPYYSGELNSIPITSKDQNKLQAGDTVIFLPEHVIDIFNIEAYNREEEERVRKAAKRKHGLGAKKAKRKAKTQAR